MYYMNDVNKTLYIPLYGKALVSSKNIIIQDKKQKKFGRKKVLNSRVNQNPSG